MQTKKTKKTMRQKEVRTKEQTVDENVFIHLNTY